MAWKLLLEPLNADDTEWLVSAVESGSGGDELGRVSERVKGNQGEAEIVGRRLIARTEEIRAARSRAIEITVKPGDEVPVPGHSPAEYAKRAAGLEKTKTLRAQCASDIARLEGELVDLRAKLASFDASIASEEEDFARHAAGVPMPTVKIGG